MTIIVDNYQDEFIMKEINGPEGTFERLRSKAPNVMTVFEPPAPRFLDGKPLKSLVL